MFFLLSDILFADRQTHSNSIGLVITNERSRHIVTARQSPLDLLEFVSYFSLFQKTVLLWQPLCNTELILMPPLQKFEN